MSNCLLWRKQFIQMALCEIEFDLKGEDINKQSLVESTEEKYSEQKWKMRRIKK